jgi:hypothetical protein
MVNFPKMHGMKLKLKIKTGNGQVPVENNVLPVGKGAHQLANANIK